MKLLSVNSNQDIANCKASLPFYMNVNLIPMSPLTIYILHVHLKFLLDFFFTQIMISYESF